ncbi:MAG: glutamine-hydrolyzing GMP synthase [Candidatus Njordarchaeia archaeon]
MGVVVIDFGSQYTHLICKRVRELKRNCLIVPWNKLEELESIDYGAIILSGGPASVYDVNAPSIPEDFIENNVKKGIAILGICYGHQLLGKIYRGSVRKGKIGEYGPTEFHIIKDSKLFKGTPKKFTVWMNHSDVIVEPPKNFLVTGKTLDVPVAAMEHETKKIFSVQFHPEVKHTMFGQKILENFLELANIPKVRTATSILEEKVREVKNIIGDRSVVVAASGGVDSTVLIALLKKAGVKRIYAIIIDTGLMRIGEVEDAVKTIKEIGVENVVVLNASDLFYKALEGVEDPEEKRKNFAKTYSIILEKAIRGLMEKDRSIKFFAQGTIYPDVVESGKGGVSKDKIKSHHNVVMPILKELKLFEPFRDLYKYEIREIGKLMGLPSKIIKKKPFPGPGLAVRILGAVTREKIEIAKRLHKIVEEVLEDYDKIDEIWQVFPVLLNSESTGVKGDKRSYGYIVALRAVESEDGMTANIHEFPYRILKKIANRITGEIEDVNRVLYDITDKPPATIEFE